MICGNCFSELLDGCGICTACGHDNAKNREAYPLALPAGSILYGRYIIGKVLGQGGFGITYLAEDYQTKEKVAIKEFFPGAMATRTGTTVIPFSGVQGENFTYGRTTFLDEAKTMAEFNGNPNIAGVQVYFEENGTAYFVMEYLDGCSFGDYVAKHGGRLSWVYTAQIMLPVLKVLGQIHEKGIIHRDVAPDNIFVTKDGTVKLLDFGAARHSLGNVSQSLDVVIKHGFAPKEQYSRRGRQGPYTDVYAACATIYFALTGVKPDESIDRAEEDTLPPPTVLNAKISTVLEDVIMKGLSVDAKDRYQSAAELYQALIGQGTDATAGEQVKNDQDGETDTPDKTGGESPNDDGNILDTLKKRRVWLTAGIVLVCVLLFYLLHPHKYGDWVTVTDNSCESTGLMERKCYCGHKDTRILPALGHDEVVDPGFDATCTQQGLTNGIHCERCGKEIVHQQLIPMLDHEIEYRAAVAATCTDKGKTEGYGCKHCDYMSKTQTSISALGHNFSGNDCTRCDAKLWWVEFTTTKKNFAIGEYVELIFELKSNEKGKSTKAITIPDFFNYTKPSTVIYHRLYVEYPSGATSLSSPYYYNNAEPIEAGSTTTVWWEDGHSKSGTYTLRIYNEDNYLLGSYTFYVS